MKQIKLTQGKFAIVDDEEFEYLNQWKWHCSNRGYAIRTQKNKKIFMHRIINNTPKELFTDHINGDILNNRKVNLRACTTSQNGFNRKLNINNTSGYKGIVWHKRDNKWQVQIKAGSKNKYIGSFSDQREAIQIYNKIALQEFGEFVRKAE